MTAASTRLWPRLLMALLLSALCAGLLLFVGPLPRSWVGFAGYTIMFFTWFAPTLRAKVPAPLRWR